VLGDAGGLIGVEARARRDGEVLRVRVRAPALDAEGELEVALPEAGHRYAVFPPIRWNRAKLAAVAAQSRTPIEIALARDGVEEGEYSAEHRLHAAAEAPYFLDDGGDPADLSWIFAAYVDEHDPQVTALLVQARELGVVDAFDGYASRDPAAVYRQLFAVWSVLEKRGLRYSALTRSASVRNKVWVQNVRTIEHSLSDRAANCVDGSVLIASLLRAAGIDAALVLVPGHMFLRVALDRDGARYAYLETTLINDRRAPHARAPVDLPAPDVAWMASRNRFAAALAYGESEYRRYASALARADRPEYRIVDIAAARRLGVSSIGR
jgi:transglutaminase-like putative cysteine protease